MEVLDQLMVDLVQVEVELVGAEVLVLEVDEVEVELDGVTTMAPSSELSSSLVSRKMARRAPRRTARPTQVVGLEYHGTSSPGAPSGEVGVSDMSPRFIGFVAVLTRTRSGQNVAGSGARTEYRDSYRPVTRLAEHSGGQALRVLTSRRVAALLVERLGERRSRGGRVEIRLRVVGAVAVLGCRMILGMGVPGAISRFWVGAVTLMLALSCAAPTLLAIWPDWSAPATVAGGAIGERLFRFQALLLSTWGAAVVNLMLLGIGLLCATGVSSAAALRGVGLVGGFAAAGLAAALAGVGSAVRQLAVRLVETTGQLRSQLNDGVAAFQVWREQRARQRRVARARAAEHPPEEEQAGTSSRCSQ